MDELEPNTATMTSEALGIDKEQLQRMLNAEKNKVEERRSALQAQRRAMAQELADVRWKALSSLQLEQKSVYDLVQRASEVQHLPEEAASQPDLALMAETAASSSFGTVAPEGPVVPTDSYMKDLEAGEASPMGHLDRGPVQLPANATHRLHGLCNGALKQLEFQSPSSSKYSVRDHVEFFSTPPPPSPLVLTSGLARRLMQELQNTVQEKKPSTVLEGFGLGHGPVAKMQVEQAMRPHLDRDMQLRQQWLEVVWA